MQKCVTQPGISSSTQVCDLIREINPIRWKLREREATRDCHTAGYSCEANAPKLSFDASCAREIRANVSGVHHQARERKMHPTKINTLRLRKTLKKLRLLVHDFFVPWETGKGCTFPGFGLCKLASRKFDLSCSPFPHKYLSCIRNKENSSENMHAVVDNNPNTYGFFHDAWLDSRWHSDQGKNAAKRITGDEKDFLLLLVLVLRCFPENREARYNTSSA